MVACVEVHTRKDLSPVHFTCKVPRVIIVRSDWINVMLEREKELQVMMKAFLLLV